MRSKVNSITPRRSIPSGLATRGIAGLTSSREHRTGATRLPGRGQSIGSWSGRLPPPRAPPLENIVSLDSLVSRIKPRVLFEAWVDAPSRQEPESTAWRIRGNCELVNLDASSSR